MQETIYARTLNPEYYDYKRYSIENDEGNKVIIDGGREFANIDIKGYLKAIEKIMEDYQSWDYEQYYQNSIKDFLEDYLPKKENGKKLSPKELGDIRVALELDNEEEIICLCLKVITGEPYFMRAIRGTCQGDYAKAYAPIKEQEHLNWVEDWYWGTGIEVEIHDSNNTPTNADEVSGYTIYLECVCSNKTLKERIKEYIGCKDDTDIKLWEYTGTQTIKIDEYKLAD